MPEELTPVIREEEYLAAIAGQDVTPPDPATRKEEWLDAIADNVADIAGDVEDLQAIVPTPAAIDEGKVLTAGDDGTASWIPVGGIYSLSADVQTAVLTLIGAVITDILTNSRTVPVMKRATLTHSGAADDIATLRSAAAAFMVGRQVATPMAADTLARALQAYLGEDVEIQFFIPNFRQNIPGVGDRMFTVSLQFYGESNDVVVSVTLQAITDIS